MNTHVSLFDDIDKCKFVVYQKRDENVYIEYASFDNHVCIQMRFTYTRDNVECIRMLRNACNQFIINTNH